MASYEVSCPNQHKLRVTEAHFGKTVQCPKCQVQFVVPNMAGGSAPAVAPVVEHPAVTHEAEPAAASAASVPPVRRSPVGPQTPPRASSGLGSLGASDGVFWAFAAGTLIVLVVTLLAMFHAITVAGIASSIQGREFEITDKEFRASHDMTDGKAKAMTDADQKAFKDMREKWQNEKVLKEHSLASARDTMYTMNYWYSWLHLFALIFIVPTSILMAVQNVDPARRALGIVVGCGLILIMVFWHIAGANVMMFFASIR